MKRYNKFLILWVLNSLIIFLSDIIFSVNVTIGNSIFADYQAIVFSGFLWTTVIWLVLPAAKDLEVSLSNKNILMLIYLAVNFCSVWFLARYSFITGIGIANYWYVLSIAVFANLLQYLTWEKLNKLK